MNDRLRGALLRKGVSIEALAARCGVDPKTAGRWVTTGRTSHPRHRQATADLLSANQEELWPSLRDKYPHLRPTALPAEIVTTYPDRASVPRSEWLRLLSSATRQVDVLVFSGTFLAQTNPKIVHMLLDRAAAGVQVRVCFGDPAGSAVDLRDQEVRIGGTLGAKIRASLSYFGKLASAPNCDVRLHNTTLYASMFRYDDEALINPDAIPWQSDASRWMR